MSSKVKGKPKSGASLVHDTGEASSMSGHDSGPSLSISSSKHSLPENERGAQNKASASMKKLRKPFGIGNTKLSNKSDEGNSGEAGLPVEQNQTAEVPLGTRVKKRRKKKPKSSSSLDAASMNSSLNNSLHSSPELTEPSSTRPKRRKKKKKSLSLDATGYVDNLGGAMKKKKKKKFIDTSDLGKTDGVEDAEAGNLDQAMGVSEQKKLKRKKKKVKSLDTSESVETDGLDDVKDGNLDQAVGVTEKKKIKRKKKKMMSIDASDPRETDGLEDVEARNPDQVEEAGGQAIFKKKKRKKKTIDTSSPEGAEKKKPSEFAAEENIALNAESISITETKHSSSAKLETNAKEAETIVESASGTLPAEAEQRHLHPQEEGPSSPKEESPERPENEDKESGVLNREAPLNDQDTDSATAAPSSNAAEQHDKSQFQGVTIVKEPERDGESSPAVGEGENGRQANFQTELVPTKEEYDEESDIVVHHSNASKALKTEKNAVTSRLFSQESDFSGSDSSESGNASQFDSADHPQSNIRTGLVPTNEELGEESGIVLHNVKAGKALKTDKNALFYNDSDDSGSDNSESDVDTENDSGDHLPHIQPALVPTTKSRGKESDIVLHNVEASKALKKEKNSVASTFFYKESDDSGSDNSESPNDRDLYSANHPGEDCANDDITSSGEAVLGTDDNAALDTVIVEDKGSSAALRKQVEQLHEQLEEKQREIRMLEELVASHESNAIEQDDQIAVHKGMIDDFQEDYDMVLGKYNEQVEQNALQTGLIGRMKHAELEYVRAINEKTNRIQVLEEQLSILQKAENIQLLPALEAENERLRRMISLQKQGLVQALRQSPLSF
ncbi:unnamed protein product [Cylindrotheca closterium]|uniref:Uncharacterized protein n=1 Tax=Cylindrotheca closterium TaxID=2856 RepID=A0AAD2JK26_9STRA|nr:unnamed protein product [Cylindrotheca closterium]